MNPSTDAAAVPRPIGPRARAAPAGLALAQLLIVLACVLVLAALLLPATVYALGRVRKTTCLARIHAIHAALSLYSADYDRHLPLVHFPRPTGIPQLDGPPPDIPYPFPPPPAWYTLRVALGDYVDDPAAFFCPASPEVPLPRRLAWPAWARMTYEVNPAISALDLDRCS